MNVIRFGPFTQRLFFASLLAVLGGLSVASPVRAGLLGYPVPRLQPLHLQVGIAGDSFRTDLSSSTREDAEATTGRALLTLTLGLTPWSEVFARIGVAEFNVDEAIFEGDFGLAYGAGARLRLWRFPFMQLGLMGQYLRFTSDDADSAGVPFDGEWEEFDVGLGLGTKRFGAFQFYTGVAYHLTHITLEGPESRIKLEEDIPVLAFLGLHIYPFVDFPGGEFLVHVEARFIGEIPQFTIGVSYQF